MIVYLMAGVGFIALLVVLAAFIKFTEDDDIPRPPRR